MENSVQYGFITVNNTILQFNQDKLTKNHVVKSIRGADFTTRIHDHDNHSIIFLDHIVKVGLFEIRLFLQPVGAHKNLRDYGKFYIRVFETKPNKDRSEIMLLLDERFCSQYWAAKNFHRWLKIKDLVEVIMYCSKISRLKVFL